MKVSRLDEYYISTRSSAFRKNGISFPLIFSVLPLLSLVRLVGDGKNQPASSSKILHAQKIETLTLSQLNQYVITFEV